MLHRPQKEKKGRLFPTNPRLEAPLPPFFVRTMFRNSPRTPASPLIGKSTTLRSTLWCSHYSVAKRQQISCLVTLYTYGRGQPKLELVRQHRSSWVTLVFDWWNIARVYSVRCRYSRYRYGCRTELTQVSGTGIDVVPNILKCPVPVLMYRNYRSVWYRYESLYRYRRYRYPYRTELTEVSGAGVDVVPKLPNCPVPVLMWYRTYRSVRYRYYRR